MSGGGLRGWGPRVALAAGTVLLSACGGSNSGSEHLPAGVTNSYLGRVQWAHTRCPHIATDNRLSCSFADALVSAYYAHPSTDFKMSNPKTGRTVEITCTFHSGYLTCSPLQVQLEAVSFTGPAPKH